MIVKDKVKFGTSKIEYTIGYSKSRTAAISVFPCKSVRVVVPEKTTKKRTRQLIKNKASWIIKKIDFFNKIPDFSMTKEYLEGETILYFGRQYKLRFIKTNKERSVKLKGKYLEIRFNRDFASDEERKDFFRKIVMGWYRKQADRNIREALLFYSKRLGVETPSFKIRNQRTKWGSCTPENNLIFNVKIMMAPKTQFDYVVAHELCHLKIKNHSKEFWDLLQGLMGDYEFRKEQLRNQGGMYWF